MSGTRIEFSSRGDDGIWAGTFAATLGRQDPSAVDPAKADTLDAPVSIEGSFSVRVP